jgi:hypothetical protein
MITSYHKFRVNDAHLCHQGTGTGSIDEYQTRKSLETQPQQLKTTYQSVCRSFVLMEKTPDLSSSPTSISIYGQNHQPISKAVLLRDMDMQQLPVVKRKFDKQVQHFFILNLKSGIWF